ncbi:MAG: pyrroline-5-carboxylate reductase [Pirellulaceae bacterium]|nr:pyrroline-5-carboxylate reductase [Pirellulaceae bacterium]MDP7019701.1 pyrroline-5-carboxylate reductase [Pirellulaceae bacterium]
MTQRIGFIGAGQMAQALAKGFLEAGLAGSDQILAFDPAPATLSQFTELTGGAAAETNQAVVGSADVVFLAVKPQRVADAAADVAASNWDEKLLVSIAAGVSLHSLHELFGAARIIRVMPNTPCLVGSGAAGFAIGPGATSADGELVRQLLNSVGRAAQVDEHLLDAVTGMSGSGPAYVYMAIEALSDGGVRMGLPRPVAIELAAQTVLGAAQMVLETGDHPGVLKDRVASPGGTTIAGLQSLEDRGFRGALIAAVEAAANRSRELGAKE